MGNIIKNMFNKADNLKVNCDVKNTLASGLVSATTLHATDGKILPTAEIQCLAGTDKFYALPTGYKGQVLRIFCVATGARLQATDGAGGYGKINGTSSAAATGILMGNLSTFVCICSTPGEWWITTGTYQATT